jgi:hypothetical protein
LFRIFLVAEDIHHAISFYSLDFGAVDTPVSVPKVSWKDPDGQISSLLHKGLKSVY